MRAASRRRRRNVTLNFSLFEMADAQTAALYQAARQRSPISVMLQLGEQAGQLCGAYMPAMVPERSGVRRFGDEAAMEIPKRQGTGDGE